MTTIHLAVWTSHPARARPFLAVCALAIVGAVSLAGSYAAFDGSATATAALAALLLLSTARFFVPTRYQLAEDGLEERSLGLRRRLPWRRVRRIEIGRDAARLCVRRAPGWTSRLGAFTIPLDGAPDEARAILETRAAALRAGALNAAETPSVS